MSPLKLAKNITFLGIASVIVMTLLLILEAPLVRDNNVYVAASIDKERNLLNVKPPRLIFIGGSNLALGLNCAKIEYSTGIHTINMGLHAGLGLSYPLNEARSGIKKGDIIILSIEHFLRDGGEKLMAQLIDVNPKAYDYLKLSIFDNIRVYIQLVQRSLSGLFYRSLNIHHSDPVYNRKGFTSRGDLISHYGKPKPPELGDNTTFLSQDYSVEINEINKFIEFAKNRGAKVYFTFPAFPASAYKRNEKALASLSSQYVALLSCPIMGTVKTFVLPDQYFFDTLYHLDSLGVQKRTDIMIDILQKGNKVGI